MIQQNRKENVRLTYKKDNGDRTHWLDFMSNTWSCG